MKNLESRNHENSTRKSSNYSVGWWQPRVYPIEYDDLILRTKESLQYSVTLIRR